MTPAPFMRDPEPESSFDVGDMVEVFCDHEKGTERIRGWLRGIVVQVRLQDGCCSVQNQCIPDGWVDGT